MMDNSKSDTPRQEDRPASSNGRLSETIANRMQDARSSLLRSPRSDDATRLARSMQISEILDRQKTLAGNRAAPAAAPNLSLADQIRERLRSPAASPSTAAAAAAPAHRHSEYRAPSAEHATVDISEALAKLRNDIKQDLASSFSQEIASLRQEIKDIGSAVADNSHQADLYTDLQRLADSMEFLSEATESAVANGMRSEIDALKAMVGDMARQDDIAVVVEHFEMLRQQLAESEANSPAKDLDAKIVSLADAISMFVSQMSSADRDLNTQMHSLDDRLAEIAAAIDANAMATAELSGDAGLGSLEARVARLIEEIDAVNLQQSGGVAERIEALAARMEELAKAQATDHLDRRFDELADLLKQNGGAAVSGDALGEVISDISSKIDAMARGTVNSALIDRFDALVSRIDTLDAGGAQAGMSDEILAWLDERMNDIAARIDSSAKSAGNPAADLGVLEEQIATLTKLLSEPHVAGEINSAAMASRMSALEDYMSTNDEYVVEAARQAAETALEAYVRNFSGQASGAGVSPADLSMISGLASDLHALEELTRSGEERNQQTFETLQQTLVQIAERLDHIGQAAEGASAAPVAAKAPALVRNRLRTGTGTDAEMFSHDFDDDDLFDDDIAVGDVGGQGGAKPAKGIFATIGKRFLQNSQDTKAEAPRRTLDTPPAMDAADDISPDIANQLLEPGSGAPDIRQILEKVRAVQEGKTAKGATTPARDEEDSDYIAVARRAAQAAAAEMGPGGRVSDPAAESSGVVSKYRRPLLLGTGLVVLAVMSWPLVSTFFAQPSTPDQNQIPAAVQTAPAAAGVDTQPNATDAKAESAKPASETAPSQPAEAAVSPEAGPTKAADTAAAPAAPAEAAPAPASDSAAPAAADAKPDNTPPAVAAPSTTDAKPATPAAEAMPAQEMPKTEAQPADAGTAIPAAAATAPVNSSELIAPAGIEPAALADAAKANDPLAIFEVGNRIFDGRGVTADPAAALAWYNKAAGLGFAPAEYRLGSMYEKGVGVSIDPSKAVEHYLAAARAGNISAMHNLAVLYATGTLGAPDFSSAAKWFTEAANHGVRDSQFNLAILYAKGSGVTQDLEQSYKWFSVAAKDGDVDAAQKRDEVGKVLTGDQLTKAKADVEGWKVSPVDDKANATVIPDAWAGKAQKTSSVDMKKAITYIQAMLNKNGFDVGRPDGVMGAKTVAAIKQFQSSVGQQPTGDINDALVKELIARSK